MEVKAIPMIIDHEEIEDIPEGKDITKKEVEYHLIIRVEGIQIEEDPLMMEDPLMVEDLPMMKDP